MSHRHGNARHVSKRLRKAARRDEFVVGMLMEATRTGGINSLIVALNIP
jgi:hypothetical protein